MFKKVFSIFISLLMMIVLFGCQQNESSIIGKWNLENEDESNYLEFKEDNELVVNISGFTAEGTYSLEENNISFQISMLGETVLEEEGTYELNGDKLTMTLDGSQQTFTRIKE